MSPAELAKLEHAFATDPASDAYKSLAEAYLAMGRFMEAMVVCKKGVKAHPDGAEPRVLLARVYAEQGKDKKAIEELQGALPLAPSDVQVLRMLGVLQLKSGENDAGKANLLKAFEVDPNDAETKAAVAQWKLEPPRAAAPAAPRPAAMAAEPGDPAPRARVATSESIPAVRPPSNDAGPRRATGESIPAVQADPAPRRATGESIPAVQADPAPRRATSESIPAVRKPAPAYVPPAEDVDDIDEESDESAPRRKKPAAKSAKATRTRLMFLGMLVAFPVVLGTYYTVGQMRARRNHEIKKHLSDAAELLKHDSFESYKKACATAEKALELDPDSGKAHALLAYAYAIRWGEHSGDSARKPAEEHLEAALKSGEISSYTVAAQALTKTYSGKGQEALKELEEKVKKLESENRSSSLVYLTLGMAQTNLGDLERARESLEKAQALAPDDSRVYAALGALYRRRGQDSLATKNYEQALRYEKTHPESLLGAALMLLDQDNPKFATASKMLKALLDSDPPPSPRQLATAQLERSLLISRVAMALPDLTPEAQKKLSEDTGVPADKSRAQAEVAKAEETGFTLDRQNPELHLIKGRRLLLEGNVDAAAAAIREAIKMDGSRAHFYAELARVLMQKPGGEKDARDALLTAIKTMGQSPKLLVLLGHSYRKMGKLDDAIAQYTLAVSDPKTRNPEARLALGVALREKGDNDKAQQALEKAGQEYVGQSSKVAAVQTELGRLFEAKGDRTKAEEAFTKALNSDPDYAPAYYFFAKFLSGKDNSKAKTFAQEYLNREPRGEYAEATKSLL